MNKISESYFQCFQTLTHFQENTSTTNTLALLGILSYFTLVIPLCMGMVALYGRILKNTVPSPQTKSVQQIASETLGPPPPSITPTTAAPPTSLSPRISETQKPTPTISISKTEHNKRRINLRKFHWSASHYEYPNDSRPETRKKTCEDWLQLEIQKFETFLTTQTPDSADIIHVCIGAGDRIDQVFPRFFFDAVEKNQSVHTLYFEGLFSPLKVPENDYCTTIENVYRSYLQSDKDTVATPSSLTTDALLEKLDKNPFHQFLCGYPEKSMQTVDTLDDLRAKVYPFTMNTFWPTSSQRDGVIENFRSYLTKALQADKTVVLGVYWGQLSEEMQLMYNEFHARFPQQVHLFWRWEGLNVKASQKLEKEDLNPRNPPSSKWIQLQADGRDCCL